MHSTIRHRITSLERWGMRQAADFQPAGLQAVKDAGFTAILVNGGSGIGPDMLPPEALLTTEAIPDLMPLTTKAASREFARRCAMVTEAGLNPWLCMWGVTGPDVGSVGQAAESNRFFDRRSKLELHAKLRRTPEIFGHRAVTSLGWRGNRPLCVSHPLVQAFYGEFGRKFPDAYPDLEGIFFFPGDVNPELCDETCPQCQATGEAAWDLMIAHVNRLYEAVQETRPGFKFYFTVWNQDQANGWTQIERFLDRLAPGIGICMSLSDGRVVERGGASYTYNQPWVTMPEYGDLFLKTAARCEEQGRAVMVLGEVAQSEVWDPPCHNFPEPGHTLRLLQNTETLAAADAILDFWGHRGPFYSHANLAAMAEYFAAPREEPAELLRRAARAHYVLADADGELIREALAAWDAAEQAVDSWRVAAWCQRFSYAIGRDSARGRIYQPLVPAVLRRLTDDWSYRQLFGNGMTSTDFLAWMREDREAFVEASERFEQFAGTCLELGLGTAAVLAEREAANIELAGELIVSIARTLRAVDAFQAGETVELRAIVLEEIEARERQLLVSGRIGFGGGVNPILVSEDLQNMRLWLSCDDFPDVPDELFHFTPTPYSV